MANPLLVALGIPLATLAVLALVDASGSSTPPSQPQPQPQPSPTPNLSLLMQKLDQLMTKAKADPKSVNPDDLEALAVGLDQAGFPTEAATVRQEEAVVRAAQGGGPVTGTGSGNPAGRTPARIPVPGSQAAKLTPDQQTLLRDFLNPAKEPPAAALDQLAAKIRAIDPFDALALTRRAAQIRAAGILIKRRHPAGAAG